MVPRFPKSISCQIGAPTSRFENIKGGGIRTVIDPGPKLRFIRLEGSRYHVEVDGEPRPIRRTHQTFWQSEAGREPAYEPERSEGETADLKHLVKCLAFRPKPERKENGVRYEYSDNWGHFRQWTFYRIEIGLAEDGAVVIEEDIGEMDGSYY